MDSSSRPDSGFRAAWHIAYICAIFFIILIALIICLADDPVCDTAMTNVSFASTIVSIVLAVVSIVISLFAAFRTSENVGSMQDVVKSLDNSIRHLRKIKTIASDNNKRLAKLTADALSAAPQNLIEEKHQQEASENGENDNSDTSVATSPSSIDNTTKESAISTTPLPSFLSRPNTNQDSIENTGLSTQEIENLALHKIKSLFGFEHLKRNYLIRGVSPMALFDGVADTPHGLYIFDVKVIPGGRGLLRVAIDTFKRRMEGVRENYNMDTTHIYLIIVFRGNNKETVLSHNNYAPYLTSNSTVTLLYFNLNEL